LGYYTNHSVFLEKETENLKKRKTDSILAQNLNMARSSPCGVKNKATKVWAAEAFAYLGRIWPKRYELSSCDGRSRATLGTSKLGRVTLAHFSSSPHLYLHPSE
jgi:hypothetical protein